MEDRPAITMSQHFRKRKACTSSAPASPRRAPAAATSTSSSCSASMGTDHLFTDSRPSDLPAVSTTVPAEGAALAAALTALKVSLKREMESFLPPTPAASPIHSRSAKRPRFEIGSILPDSTETKASSSSNTVFRPKASPVPKPRGTAFLSVNKKLQQELERRSRPDSSDIMLRARKRRQQLSYFAIASAFHRAATDRGLALVPATPVGE